MDDKLSKEAIKDGEAILNLIKFAGRSPGKKEIDDIYFYYKKYINFKATEPITNCSNCSRSLSAYWVQLAEFYQKNTNLFIQ